MISNFDGMEGFYAQVLTLTGYLPRDTPRAGRCGACSYGRFLKKTIIPGF
jgi:hypothetical protein